MPGSFDVTADSVSLGRSARLLAAFLFDGTSRYALLSNVRVLAVEAPGEGAKTGSARFRYAFGDPLGDSNDPRRFEQVYPLDAAGQRVVLNDDRLVVRAFSEDGSSELLFDGFVQLPQADVSSQGEAVSFEALGTPVREWDTPLGGALVRDADHPETVSNIPTDNPARFNPDGHPNATPEADTGEDDPGKYRVFLGPVWPRNKINGQDIKFWTLVDAAKYVIARGNPTRQYTRYADLDLLNDLLVTVAPKAEGGTIDFADSSTYKVEPIEVDDIDVRGAAWPEALEALLTPYGFAMRFRLLEDGDGNPAWRLNIYRRDDLTRVKSLFLQRAGDDYDPGRTNVLALKLARDAAEVANRFVLDTAPVQKEASFVLEALFTPAAGDATNPEPFIATPDGVPPEKYRLWGFDECGEGHWDRAGSTFVTGQPGDFKKVLGTGTGGASRPFVKRRRPAKGSKLLSVDDLGKPLKATLHVATDYTGDIPGVWDGTSGTWREVTQGWDLLDDRLGFRVPVDDPNNWHIGKVAEGSPVVYDGDEVLRLVELCAAPTTAAPFPVFRLTCVVEADVGLGTTAPRRASSPTRFPVTRRVDTSDRFRKRIATKYSAMGDPMHVGESDFAETDDTAEAQGYADALRRSREAGSFAGSVTLNGIRTSYSVGDKVDGIVGRGVSLRQNLGAGQGESPQWPTVVAVRWECDAEQRTVLQLEDLRAGPPPRRRKVRED